LSLLCQFAVVVARTWVRLYQAMDNSFITLNDTLKDACGARALQVRGINISSIPYVISVQEKCSMRHQVISMKELELILVEKEIGLLFALSDTWTIAHLFFPKVKKFV
jgi:hypothetical protein